MELSQLKITSFNCSGFKPRNYDYINDIYNKCDILLLQETWLYNFESVQFNNILPDCQYHSTSAMDESDIHRNGRPFGGVATVWHNDLAISVTPVTMASPRICAVVIKSATINIVLCNVYMPCDNGTQESFITYGEVLFDMLALFETYNGYDIIIGGDLNVDFSRVTSRNLSLLKQVINDEFFTCLSLEYNTNEFTFMNSNGDKSFIDRFIASENITNYNITVAHDGNNLTSHQPITLETSCQTTIIPRKIVSRDV